MPSFTVGPGGSAIGDGAVRETTGVPKRPPVVAVGWREWVALPDLGIGHVKAKVDTGARSSALHAHHQVEFVRDGTDWVRFAVHPWQRTASDEVVVELPVHDRRVVRSSSGHRAERLTVVTGLVVAGRRVEAEITLTRRDEMGFRLLVGRQALRGGFVVDAARSYLGGRPSKEVRQRNRGR
jgi:hypothetical protein